MSKNITTNCGLFALPKQMEIIFLIIFGHFLDLENDLKTENLVGVNPQLFSSYE